jgi:transcription factor IIIB subunit 2
MTARCAHCDALTVWDDAVGSSVCTSCGSLVDPSQSVLTSLSEGTLWHDTTLKSLRSGNNWDLSGQGKEARDRRNAVCLLS